MPGEPELHPVLLHALIHVGAEGPPVAAVVERPLVAGLLDSLDRRLVVEVQVRHLQGAHQRQVWIVRRGRLDARGAGRQQRRRRRLAPRGGVGGGAGHIVSQRLVAQVVDRRQPAGLPSVRVHLGQDGAQKVGVVGEAGARHGVLVDRVVVEAPNPAAVGGDELEAHLPGDRHALVGRGEVDVRLAILPAADPDGRDAGERGAAVLPHPGKGLAEHRHSPVTQVFGEPGETDVAAPGAGGHVQFRKRRGEQPRAELHGIPRAVGEGERHPAGVSARHHGARRAQSQPEGGGHPLLDLRAGSRHDVARRDRVDGALHRYPAHPV